ncbi:hypothetical protein EYF80_033916 [Liparis tanakae]|uniref:Uncharacterized protein n=1 Tax=Liparis tanakae TaxID=230148 RepID=A0A4Z2GQ79_9TELE|nr:hypothetical protein EYF80_033916 [Liparis tanakae]
MYLEIRYMPTARKQEVEALAHEDMADGITPTNLPPREPTFRAAKTSGLSSEPMEKVWMGYCSCCSLASFTSVAATRLESRPPEEEMTSSSSTT